MRWRVQARSLVQRLAHDSRFMQSMLAEQGTPDKGKDIGHSHIVLRDSSAMPTAAHVCRMDGFDSDTLWRNRVTGSRQRRIPMRTCSALETKPYWDFATQYTLADEMFFTETASSFIAHQMIISGTVRAQERRMGLTDQPMAGPPWGCFSVPGDNSPILYANGKEVLSPSSFRNSPLLQMGDDRGSARRQ